MPDMKAPMTEENKARALVEEHWDYPIGIDVDYILKRFENNHNRKLFINNEEEYWNLIKKAIIITCRMAEHYREKSIDLSRYKFDNILVSGGGGVNEKYTIFAMRNVAFWQLQIGNVEINFKEKTLSVWLYEWEDKEKKIDSYNGRKLYKKEIENINFTLENYMKKYYRKESKF